MELIQFSDHLQSKFKSALNASNAIEDELLKVGNTLKTVSAIIRELKEFVSTYSFSNQAEQVKFFKEIKPIFLSQYYYYQEVFEIRLFDSFKPMEERRRNYQKILSRLERFASNNKEFYQYCLTNASYLDVNYFTIGDSHTTDLERDEKFSTGFDSKLGRLLANELLKQYVFNLLNKVQASGTSTHSKLIWTGQKTALVELIYALHASGSFNNGSTEINDIASGLSSLFQISLGDFYRIFQDIGNRKTGQTKFLDELKSKLLQRINSNAE